MANPVESSVPQSAPARSDDLAALHRSFQAMLDRWTDGDARGYADLFATDVCYVGFDGYAFRSREELRTSHDELFRGVLRGSRLVGSIEDIRAVSADVMVLHCRGAVVTRGRATAGPGRDSVQTIVARRDDRGWLFTDFHNTRYRPLPSIVRWYMRHAARRPSGERPSRRTGEAVEPQ